MLSILFISLFALILGLAFCFAGYRVFLVMLPIWGFFAGFWLGAMSLARSDHDFLRDLPVIENLEALQQVENVEFLHALQNEGLFVAEVSDEP